MSVLIIKNNDNIDLIIDVIKGLVGNNIIINKKDDFILINHQFEEINDIKKTLESISEGLFINILAYNTSVNNSKIDMEVEIALSLLNQDIPYDFYDLKKLIHCANLNTVDKAKILDFILFKSGISKGFIESFIDNNLNVSLASKKMYLHRNTINYKLDKLKEVSNFDLRNFKDAFIIYLLF